MGDTGSILSLGFDSVKGWEVKPNVKWLPSFRIHCLPRRRQLLPVAKSSLRVREKTKVTMETARESSAQVPLSNTHLAVGVRIHLIKRWPLLNSTYFINQINEPLF